MVADEDAEAIAVENLRAPVGGAELLEQDAVAVQVVGGSENQD